MAESDTLPLRCISDNYRNPVLFLYSSKFPSRLRLIFSLKQNADMDWVNFPAHDSDQNEQLNSDALPKLYKGQLTPLLFYFNNKINFLLWLTSFMYVALIN